MDTRSARNETQSIPPAGGVTPWQPERWPITTPQAPTVDQSFFDNYGSHNYYVTRRRARRDQRASWLWYGIWSLLGLVFAATSSGGGSSHTRTVVPAALAGVNVCAASDVNTPPQGCTAGDTAVAVGSGARVCYSMSVGSTPTEMAISFAVQRLDEHGAPLAQGVSSAVVSNAHASWCRAIDMLIHTARLPLTPGSYRVAAQFDAVDLGTTTFTLTAPTR